MAAVAAGAAIVGAGTSIFGQIKGAQDQASIDQQKALLAGIQSNELLAREKVNDSIRQDTAQRIKSEFSAASMGRGEAPIASMMEIQRQTDLQIALNDRDAEFQSRMLLAGGALDQQLAEETRTAGYFNAAGTLLTGAGTIARNNLPKTPSQLPELPAGA